MRHLNKKPLPDHFQTRYFSQVEAALRQGYEVIVHTGGRGRWTRRIVAMHRVGDRVLFFDPKLNPTLGYSDDAVLPMPADGPTLPTSRYEGIGLHSVEAKVLHAMFMDGIAFAWVPQGFRFDLNAS